MTPHLYRLLRQFQADAPLDEARTIPARWYTDPELTAYENERLFTQVWLVAGRSDQVAHPGDYFTAEVAGRPLVIARDTDGNLRGFYNICRHRAARVVTEEHGHGQHWRCRYHGWTYDLSGLLRGAPECAAVTSGWREHYHLYPVTVAEWPPLVFVHLGQPSLPLAEYLTPLPQKMAPWHLERLHFVTRRVYNLACNWKVFVDNYLDGGYHVPTLHRSLAAVLDYRHYVTETYRYCSLQHSPLKQPDSDLEDASAASVRTGKEAAYWWLFPNFMLNVYQGVMDTNLVWPLGPDRCRVIFDFYFADPAGTPQADRFHAESIAVAERVQQEDADICEQVQRGLASGVFDTGPYCSRREMGVYHFHRLLAQFLTPSTTPQG